MKILRRDDTDHNTEYVTKNEAMEEILAMENRLLRAEKTLKSIEEEALKIIPGYGKTALSDFTTPVSVMYRLRDEVDTLRKQLKADEFALESNIDKFIDQHEVIEKLKSERDGAIKMREWDNRSISIARHYHHQKSGEPFEDGRIRPALVLEKAVAVAIDGWVDGNPVTIQLCAEECEQWVALVVVHGQDTTAFSLDGNCDIEREPEEVWLSSAVLEALDHARKTGPVVGQNAHAQASADTQPTKTP
jgi:hypothetical protein